MLTEDIVHEPFTGVFVMGGGGVGAYYTGPSLDTKNHVFPYVGTPRVGSDYGVLFTRNRRVGAAGFTGTIWYGMGFHTSTTITGGYTTEITG